VCPQIIADKREKKCDGPLALSGRTGLTQRREDGAGKNRACRRGVWSCSFSSHENAFGQGENCEVGESKNRREMP
jgi:hypothetical protein